MSYSFNYSSSLHNASINSICIITSKIILWKYLKIDFLKASVSTAHVQKLYSETQDRYINFLENPKIELEDWLKINSLIEDER